MLLYVTLLQGGESYQLLGKIATHFPHFYLLIHTLKLKFKFLYIPPTHFYYKPPSCPLTSRFKITTGRGWGWGSSKIDKDLKTTSLLLFSKETVYPAIEEYLSSFYPEVLYYNATSYYQINLQCKE